MLIKIRVTTGAKNAQVRKVADDCYEVMVRERPEGGAANASALALLSHTLNIPAKKLRIIKGHRSPSKTISTPSITQKKA